MYKKFQRGEIATFLSIGALIVVGIGIALGLGYGQRSELQNSRAEAGGSCTYKSYVHVYKEEEGVFFGSSEAGVMKVTNDRRQPLTLNKNERTENWYTEENFVLDPTRIKNYAANDPAIVTLSDFDTSQWEVKQVFCTNRGLRGCPGGDDLARMNAAIANGSSSGVAIDGFRVNCGVDLTYGWILKRKDATPPTETVTPPTTTPPTTTPPTTTPPTVTPPTTTPPTVTVTPPTTTPPTTTPPTTTPPTITPFPPNPAQDLNIIVQNENPNVRMLSVRLFPCPDGTRDVCQKGILFEGRLETQSVRFTPGVEIPRKIFIRDIVPMNAGLLSWWSLFVRPVFAQANGKAFVVECGALTLPDGDEDQTCYMHAPGRAKFKILTPDSPNPPRPTPRAIASADNSPRKIGSCRYMVAGACSEDTFKDVFSDVAATDPDILKKISALCHATTGSMQNDLWKPETVRELYDLQGLKAWETLARRCGYVQ